MKLQGILFIFIAIIGLTSCKEETVQFVKPEKSMYFHGFVNNREKTIIEDQNGYRFSSDDSCATILNGETLYTVSSIFQGNSNYYMSNREAFGCNFHNLYDVTLDSRDDVITSYFTNPMPFAYIDSLTGIFNDSDYGVEITWTDGEGNVYTTLNTPQAGSIVFDSFAMEFVTSGRQIILSGTFSCYLYSQRKNALVSLTDGQARIKINTACF